MAIVEKRVKMAVPISLTYAINKGGKVKIVTDNVIEKTSIYYYTANNIQLDIASINKTASLHSIVVEPSKKHLILKWMKKVLEAQNIALENMNKSLRTQVANMDSLLVQIREYEGDE